MMEFFDGRAWRDLGFAIMPPNISRLVGYFGRIQFFDMNGTLNMPVWYETRYIKPGSDAGGSTKGGIDSVMKLSAPPWHQIALREAAVERAWQLPKVLINQGWVTPP